MIHTSSSLIMIRPKHFNYNIETAGNNFFQKRIDKMSKRQIKKKSVTEFNQLVKVLKENDVEIDVYDDRDDIITTDSIFPNNWFSLHTDGNLYLYPMFSKNRRKERREDIIKDLQKRYRVKNIIDLTSYEKENKFLEGTGSMVFDRKNKMCYASISERTDKTLIEIVCDSLGYQKKLFTSYQSINNRRQLIYHTNVIMNIAEDYAIICLDSIDDKRDRNMVVNSLINSGKKVIEISEDQLNNFAGNMLQVKNKRGEKLLVMSKCAYKSLQFSQLELIESFNKIIYSDLDTIETLGGGSARCMLAENFLEKK